MKKIGLILTLYLIISTAGCVNSLQGTDGKIIRETSEEVLQEQELNQIGAEGPEELCMKLTIGNTTLSATLVDNSTTAALKEMLSEGPVTIDMRDYGSMEKVGMFPHALPRNDQQITTEAGDLILYQGNAFVIYYAPNSWNFTRIGKINDISAAKLKEILGNGNVSVTLSME